MSSYAEMSATLAKSTEICDLRSDTVTLPDAAMRAAIAEAEVGDDVYGEDPTVLKLEAVIASLLGKDTGLFFPTGTQSNLSAVLSHCGRGDEAIVGNTYHILRDEAAGVSVLGGVSLCQVSVEKGGEIAPESVLQAIKADDPHYAMTRLLCLENTVNGNAISLVDMRAAAEAARTQKLSIHLDGARFFNAIAELNCAAEQLAAHADTVSVCLSKGLGAPAGSVLVGDKSSISRARRNRKILGGSMRQSGILAAAGLYALEHNRTELIEDHRRAAKFADALRALQVGEVDSATNMVFFKPEKQHHNPLKLYLNNAGILIGGQHPFIRMVFHRDVSDEMLDKAIRCFQSFFKTL